MLIPLALTPNSQNIRRVRTPWVKLPTYTISCAFPLDNHYILWYNASVDAIYYVGEAGRAISLKTGFDWTGATTKEVKVKKPSGTTVTFSGTDVVVDDAVTGQIHVLTTGTTLSEEGIYMIQAKFSDGTVTRFSQIFLLEAEGILS